MLGKIFGIMGLIVFMLLYFLAWLYQDIVLRVRSRAATTRRAKRTKAFSSDFTMVCRHWSCVDSLLVIQSRLITFTSGTASDTFPSQLRCNSGVGWQWRRGVLEPKWGIRDSRYHCAIRKIHNTHPCSWTRHSEARLKRAESCHGGMCHLPQYIHAGRKNCLVD